MDREEKIKQIAHMGSSVEKITEFVQEAIQELDLLPPKEFPLKLLAERALCILGEKAKTILDIVPLSDEELHILHQFVPYEQAMEKFFAIQMIVERIFTTAIEESYKDISQALSVQDQNN